MYEESRRTVAMLAAVSGLAAGCTATVDGPSAGTHVSQSTGALVASLIDIPSDVLCVDISTSDYQYTPDVRVDVVPGTTNSVTVSPLAPGYISLSGVAYDVPCSEAPSSQYYYGYYDNVYAVDGGAYDAGRILPTWVADSTSTTVVAGETTPVELRFHQLGGLNVNVTFDNCNSDASDPACNVGEDSSVPIYPVYDAGTFSD
jgi:hypothetical protein